MSTDTNTGSKRHSKTFDIDANLPETPPQSIVANECLPQVSQFSTLQFEALPLTGLTLFFYSSLVLVIALAVFEVVRVFNYALSIHIAVAYAFAALLAVVAVLGVRVVYRYLKDKESLGKLTDLQDQAERLLEGNDFGQVQGFIKELSRFYSHKPQAVHLQHCLKELPDYSNDREAIKHLDTLFFKPLDDEATKRVSAYCIQTGVGVAISPWASLDMLLSLWRSVKMIDDVAQVYGVRPSLPNRLRLFKRVIQQLLFVGATELLTESVLAEFGLHSLTSTLSARAGQGIGAGFYTAKIGIAAMTITRPMAFSAKNKPSTAAVAADMVSKIKGMFLRSKSDQ